MRIDELDEWQGVTPELVTDWLLSHGWTQKPTQPKWWLKGDDGFLFDALTFDQVWFWAYALAAIYTNGNVQALLREINPRMRKGWPSTGALSAHAYWLAKPFGDDAFCVVWTTAEIIDKQERAGDVDIGFWPCDEHGNKVRWPTDAEGKML